MNLDSIKLAPLFISCCVICILAAANSIKPSVDKIIYYKIDTTYYQNNPAKKTNQLFIDGDIKIEMEKVGKQLSVKKVAKFNSLIANNK